MPYSCVTVLTYPSPNMVPKQKEMDEIVHTIYTAIENEDHLSNALFVLCGDHGMNEGGNHGGSSPGETSPALIFMSPKLTKITQNQPKAQSPTTPKTEGEFDYYRTVEQSDIAPTLAGLLGFPVPRNNLGVFLSDFMAFWNDGEFALSTEGLDETNESDSDRNQLLYRNARQIKRIVEATYSSQTFDDDAAHRGSEVVDCDALDSGEKLACRWNNVVRSMAHDGDDLKQHHLNKVGRNPYNRYQNTDKNKFMHDAQEIMSSAASNYDVPRLFLGTGLASLICVLAFSTLFPLRSVSSAGLFYFLTLALYTVLMFASSYVEEEHNFWYWITSGWFFYLFVYSVRTKKASGSLFHPALLVLIAHRVIRRWNQTGQKFAGADDIVSSGIFHGNSSILLWVLVGATYLDVTNRISAHVARSVVTLSDPRYRKQVDPQPLDHHRLPGTLITLPLCGTAFIFKLAFTAKDAPELTYAITPSLMAWVEALDLVGLVRVVLGGIALLFVWILSAEYQRSNRRAEREIRGKGGKLRLTYNDDVNANKTDLATSFFDLFTLFLLTQTKAQNIPLYLLFRIQFFFLSKPSSQPQLLYTELTYTARLTLTPTQTTLTTLLLSQTSFFALGLNNSISSIDLSNAYNGVSGYNILAVGLLVFLSNWAGSVYWSLAGVLLLGGYGTPRGDAKQVQTATKKERSWVQHEHQFLHSQAKTVSPAQKQDGNKGLWLQHVKLLTLFTGVMLASVMASCTALRTHLFIWTVFSPKYLFAMAWGVAWHLGVTVGLGGLVWWLGSW